ncbi:hypothetical protein ABW21_db0201439 [Orbilia brochopaga]|nr:hypothetical protein ABW21_db0201439 [Drechslerella brochopaga]
MRWLSSVAAVQLLYLLDVATAIPDYDMMGFTKKLSGRHEALLLFKRQSTSCSTGYYQCPPEFGGGCCANGRMCATRDCPAAAPGASQAPLPPPANTRPPATRPATSAPPPPTTAPATTAAPETTESPETTEAPDSTSNAPESTTDAPESTTAAPTSAPSSAPPSSTDSSSQAGSATNAADASASTTVSAADAGTLYAPPGISSGAIVGIVFAAITGAVIVGLVLWRAIIGVKNPRRKGKRPMGPGSRDVVGAAGAGSGGFFSGNSRLFGVFGGKKKSGTGAAEAMMTRSVGEDQAPMSQTPQAMGFGPHSAEGGGVPPYMQDRSSLDQQDTSYNSRGGAFAGGDLGYQSVESFDRQDSTQGLFPRAPGGGFPDR